jgi:predicted glycoside hydrolase/deacetylase ChbG (UPF0249 family)
MSGAGQRRVSLCADDYGMSEGVNRAIRDLIEKRRLSATSVMVVTPAFTRAEIDALKAAAAAAPGFAIGLHVTLTAPFHPLTMPFRPLKDGEFLKLGRLMQAAVLRRLDTEMLRAEIAAQIAAFTDMVGKAPDYVDGHQHVQLFPQVREPLLEMVKDIAPRAWVRQCGRASSTKRRLADGKALLLDALSPEFRAQAAALGIRTNPAFAGAYDFTKSDEQDFARRFPGFLDGLPPQSVVMCHPGFVDAELERLDPLTRQREREYAYLAGEAFPDMLRRNGVALA